MGFTRTFQPCYGCKHKYIWVWENEEIEYRFRDLGLFCPTCLEISFVEGYTTRVSKNGYTYICDIQEYRLKKELLNSLGFIKRKIYLYNKFKDK